MTVSRAFLVEPCERYDVSGVREHGYPVYLFPADGMRAGMFADEFVDDAREALAGHNYNPDSDFIVVAGTTALAATLVAVAAADWGRVRVLFFDARERRYTVRLIEGKHNAPATQSYLPTH